MKNFQELSNMYKELLTTYDKGNMQWTISAEQLSPIEIRICLDSLAEIMESVKLPENRKLILQEVSSKDGSISLSGSASAVKLLKMRTILAGVLQEANEKEVRDFAMSGDSGYADLRLNMVKNVVAREKAGVDYQPNDEPQGPGM